MYYINVSYVLCIHTRPLAKPTTVVSVSLIKRDNRANKLFTLLVMNTHSFMFHLHHCSDRTA